MLYLIIDLGNIDGRYNAKDNGPILMSWGYGKEIQLFINVLNIF